VAFRSRGVGGIDEIEFAVRRIVDVAVFHAGEMGPAFEVVAGQAGVDLAAADGDACPAEVEVMVVARLGHVAVVVNAAVFDALLGGRIGRAVAVRHEAHVVCVNRALADRDAVGLVDPHAGPVVRIIVGSREVETLERAAVGAAIELEDGTRRASRSAVRKPLPEIFTWRPSAIDAARKARFFCRTKTATCS